MMTMTMVMMEEEEDDLPERALLRNLRKEQEREKRRLRDRQRRQAMSIEERERHLARRRRNYQLRRQRTANSRFDDAEASAANNNSGGGGGSPMLSLPGDRRADTFDGDSQCAAADGDVPDPRQDCRLDAITNSNSSIGLEVPARKLAKLPTRSRLNHVKRLARSRDDAADDWNNRAIALDLIMERNEEDSNCVPAKGLRLNRVKQLARGLNSCVPKTLELNHRSEVTAEQNLPGGDPQVNNSPAISQPDNVRGQDE